MCTRVLIIFLCAVLLSRREGDVPLELKSEAELRVLALSSHKSRKVRAAVVSLFPDLRSLNRGILLTLYKCLKVDDVSRANKRVVRVS